MTNMPSSLERIKRIWIALFAISAIGLMGYVLAKHRTTLESLRLVEPWLLVLCVALHVGFWLLATVFWGQTVRVVTRRTLLLRESFHQLTLVAIGKYIPGKIWGLLARGVALKDIGISTRSAIAAAIVEQWVMLLSAALVSGALLMAMSTNSVLAWLGGVSVFVGLAGSYVFKYGSSQLQRLLTSNVNALDRDTIILTHGSYLRLIAIHSLMWIILGAVLAAICFAFAIHPFTVELFAALVLANTIGFVVGFAAIFAPGGLGVREAVTTAVLLPYIPLEQAAILSISFRLWTTASDGLLAATISLQTFQSARQKKNKGI